LGEPFAAVVNRNRSITVAYADLSRRLAETIAGADPELDANWCTFASWSSHTIGLQLGRLTRTRGYADVDPEPGDDRTGFERVPVIGVLLGAYARSKAASLRAMAAGNRAVFLEIGLTVATFLDHFRNRAALDAEAREQRRSAGAADRDDAAPDLEVYGEKRLEPCWERQWAMCWRSIEAQLRRLDELDLSWVLPRRHPQDALRLGMRHYLLAMRSDDPRERAEHVLTANILVASYEQRRVDGYVWAGLALFTHRAMRRLVRERTGDVGGLRRLPSRLFARLMTRGLALRLGDELVRLVDAVPPAPLPAPSPAPGTTPGPASSNGARPWRLTDNNAISLPVLQALIDCYQLSPGRAPHEGARDWTCYDDRMRTVVDLFRSRQRQQSLFEPPFDAETASRLLTPHLERPGVEQPV
jgi:hypothetical protein